MIWRALLRIKENSVTKGLTAEQFSFPENAYRVKQTIASILIKLSSPASTCC